MLVLRNGSLNLWQLFPSDKPDLALYKNFIQIMGVKIFAFQSLSKYLKTMILYIH